MNGKGDTPRKVDKVKYDLEYERIFRKVKKDELELAEKKRKESIRSGS